ncbi:T-complex protein 10 C-terminus-domain-containing protein [Fimicolochytrium jonesii]|uniref:T-complex protein 10 C-terminus-domain-containing protein n=1 Tax=Fimicolochytrium jonesii TaxID=1396493 RepID=UPI0022FEA3DC|nr:T-complex protein 10 C-terminus-domain-containing protein [Fimicolochytrium jonesii]KAI8818309.1 T-complex protein 10 C-terminus-domain-containing protein [Fimicolochytrium jonesii]
MKRERQGLEKQRKAAEILPTKRERKEVELLKTAHQALQADFKEKETRMTHAYERLKRKADDLKKENSELRIRVEELARENAGLVSLERERERENRVGVRKMASFNNKSSGVAVVRHTHPKTPETVVGARQREGSEEPPVRVKSNAGVKPAPTSAVTKVRVGTAMTRMQPRSPPGEAVDALGAKARELELPEIVEQWVGDGGKTERRYANGTCLTWYQNGTIKETRESDGITKIHYAIGDWKEILPDGDTNYWFETNKALQTRFADGRTRTRYTDGQEEWQYTDGSSEIVFADRTVRITYADNGSLQEETHFPDARVQRLERTTRRAVVHVDGTVELVYEEGVKVVKRANGSVVTVARCGTRETRYLDGRVRVKAGDGRLIYETYMDDAEHERQLQALKA